MAWLTGWTYRKPVTLSRATGAVTDYQMKLLVGESSGATGEDVDCGGLCLSTFNDLRFTASDGTTLLDYWIESVSGATPNQLATVWVEFDSIGTGDTTFYMYYGNAAASAVSSGANTFISFDDFERGADGDEIGGSWTSVVHHNHISTEQAYTGTRSFKSYPVATYSACSYVLALDTTNAISFWWYKVSGDALDLDTGDTSTAVYVKWDTDSKIYYYNGSSWVDSGATITSGAWHYFTLFDVDFAANTFSLAVDGTTILTNVAQRPAYAAVNGVLSVGTRAAGDIFYMDLFRKRNFRTTEPAFGSWGAQETSSRTWSPFPGGRLI